MAGKVLFFCKSIQCAYNNPWKSKRYKPLFLKKSVKSFFLKVDFSHLVVLITASGLQGE